MDIRSSQAGESSPSHRTVGEKSINYPSEPSNPLVSEGFEHFTSIALKIAEIWGEIQIEFQNVLSSALGRAEGKLTLWFWLFSGIRQWNDAHSWPCGTRRGQVSVLQVCSQGCGVQQLDTARAAIPTCCISWISLPGKTVAEGRCSSCDGGNREMVGMKEENQMEIQLREKGNILWTSSLYFYLWTCLFLKGFRAWRFSAFSRVQSFS